VNTITGFRADERSDLSACLVDRLVGSVTEGMVAGGVAVLLLQVGQHGVEHLRGDRGGGVVVEVDQVFGRGGGHDHLLRR
jgi:hypothetical protein